MNEITPFKATTQQIMTKQYLSPLWFINPNKSNSRLCRKLPRYTQETTVDITGWSDTLHVDLIVHSGTVGTNAVG